VALADVPEKGVMLIVSPELRVTSRVPPARSTELLKVTVIGMVVPMPYLPSALVEVTDEIRGEPFRMAMAKIVASFPSANSD